MRRDIDLFRSFFRLQRTCRTLGSSFVFGISSFAFGIGLQCVGFADELDAKIDYQEQIKTLRSQH